MKRILYFNYSNALGGAEKSLLDIIKSISRERFEPLLLTFGNGPFSALVLEQGIPVRHLPDDIDLSRFRRGRLWFMLVLGILKGPGIIRQVFRIRKAVMEIRPHIIHTNNPKSHVLGGIAVIGLDIPVVFHMRDLFSPYSLSPLLFRITASLNESRIACISKAVFDSMPRTLRARASVIYNGFPMPNINKPRENVRLGLGIGKDERIIVSAGRIVPWKGFKFLISALAPLLKDNRCKLVIMGESFYWKKDYLDSVKEHAVKLGVADRVVFTGHVESPQNVFAASDIFVLPSRLEPFGRVLAEAMLCGIPAIAMNEAGPSEIIINNKTGILIRPGDENEMRDAVHRLISNAVVCNAMGRAACDDIAERFPLQKTINEIETLYAGM